MSLNYRAAVLHRSGTPLVIERVSAGPPGPADVVVKIRAAGLCHTDLEVMSGSLRYPLADEFWAMRRPASSRRLAAPSVTSRPAIRHPVVESALWALFLLRPRLADSLRDLSGRRP